MTAAATSRSNESFLQPLERPALRWFCAHMPHWVTPDMLTTVGFVGAILTGFGYWLASYDITFLLLASVGLIINWFGDSLDGNLARYRSIERPTYGFFVDHTTDVFEQVIIMAGMALSSLYSFTLVGVALLVYLLLSILTFVRAHYLKVLQISYSGFGPTEIRALLILCNLIMLIYPPTPISIFGAQTSYPNLFTLAWIVGAGAVLVVLVAQTMRQLSAETSAVERTHRETAGS